MPEKQSVFFVESFSGARQQRRYTLELFREPDGRYRLIQCRIHQEYKSILEEKHTLAASKDELKMMSLGNNRLVKQLRRSEWWNSDEQ
ncbi:hypothetical protein HGT70_14730 [Rosenbergiella collisarenosi]|uniref:hypothetical protein n=1 Tax=Rosenbergiella collisarenosi TaxID=1544695 RepID=UPI001BDA5A5D|nr:hypothetical protein [Rosenbergiella collisarenosi]MBT0722519.1 hypothetical protein [Rosenbergiella collisarenosi]